MASRTPLARFLPILLAGALATACAASAVVPPPEMAPSPSPTTSQRSPSTSGTAGVTTPDPTTETPTPTPVVRPTATPDPSPPAAVEPVLDPPIVRHGPFAMDLYRKNDAVTEATKWYCVPAAMLTMINIMSRGAEHSRDAQKELYQLARQLSTKTLVGKGAEPIGWARGLQQLGYGGYEVGVFATRRQAVQAAAKAIRLTGRPAGVLVWRGAHSWVMSGFRATADPAATDDFTVTDVDIEDVWYPYVSSIWGASRPPNALVPVSKLKEDWLKWRRPTRRYPGMDGRFVTILPIDREVQP